MPVNANFSRYFMENLFNKLVFNEQREIILYFKKNKKFFLIYSFLLLSAIIYSRHQFNGKFNWRASIYADASGYFVYQPALYIYCFDTEKFPDSIETLVGHGFSVDSVSGKLIIKYPIGTAILQTPFFIICHFIAGISGQKTDGFSGVYHHVPDAAALFYTFLSLIFLFLLLRKYFSFGIALLSVLLTFWGTNLFFYAVDYTGMSHIYSFFLFTAFLSFIYFNSPFQKRLSFFKLLVFFSLCFLMLVTRPTNLLFILFALLFHYSFLKTGDRKLLLNINFRLILPFLISFILFIGPQMLYWKYAFGQWVKYSYAGESFSNWNHPQVLKLLCSADNGLLPYSPLFIFFIAGLFIHLKTNKIQGIILILLLLSTIYLFSSWHQVSFGCGYGSRNFVEYYSLFSIGLASLLSRILNFRKIIKTISIVFIVLSVMFGQQFMSNSDKCCFNTTWNYEKLCHQMYQFRYKKVFHLKNDGNFDKGHEFSKSYRIVQKKHTLLKWRLIFLKTRIYADSFPSDIALCLTLKDKDSTVFWIGSTNNEIREVRKGVYEIYLSTSLPPNNCTHYNLDFYIWNYGLGNFNSKKIAVLLF